MSRRKGLSHEEKRSKMLELFYEKKDFFVLKELEKIAPKEKGVISQAVKDIVQSLVDDNLVDTDKIGTGVYFWAFPSKATKLLLQRKEELLSKMTAAEKQLLDIQNKISKAQSERNDNDDRSSALASLQEAQNFSARLNQELQQYADSDPVVLARMQAEMEMALVAANRWTDNLFEVRNWCRNKFGIEEQAFNMQFDIPEDMDYLQA